MCDVFLRLRGHLARLVVIGIEFNRASALTVLASRLFTSIIVPHITYYTSRVNVVCQTTKLFIPGGVVTDVHNRTTFLVHY